MLRATTSLLILATGFAVGADDYREFEPAHPLATADDWRLGFDEHAGPPPFRTSELAEEPHGGELEPSRGYAHYDAPSGHYGLWFRPSSFGRGPGERCAPARFNPRGYGNLFAESSTPHRMDYRPYALTDHVSDQGPTYHPEPREYCCKQCLFGGRCEECCESNRGWFSRLFRGDCD